jgi:outer membrane protein
MTVITTCGLSMALLLASAGLHAADWFSLPSLPSALKDPFGTSSMTAPAPNSRWERTPDTPDLSVPDTRVAIPDEAKGPLSLSTLTDIALRMNPRTRQAWLTARAEAAGLGSVKGDDLPQITGSYGYRRQRAVSGTTGLPTACPPAGPCTIQTLGGPNVSLGYTLYDFGQGEADEEAARYRVLAANLAQNRTLQDVTFQVEQAYYRVLAFEYLVRASRESLKNFETALDNAQRRRGSGLATAGDEYRAETQVGQSRLALTRNEGELGKARGLLASTVGLPANFPLKLESVAELVPVAQITQSMDELIKKAKTERPDLAAAEARARAARAAATSAALAGRPSLELGTQWGRITYAHTAGFRRDPQDVWTVGLNLRIPIFSGFKNTYNTTRAEALAGQAESVRDQLLTQTELDVWQAYYDLQTSAASVTSTGNLVKSAGESAAAAAARYQAGVGSLLDLITAQLDDTNARVLRIQSFLDWYTALSRLNFSLGAIDGVTTRKAAP